MKGNGGRFRKVSKNDRHLLDLQSKFLGNINQFHIKSKAFQGLPIENDFFGLSAEPLQSGLGIVNGKAEHLSDQRIKEATAQMTGVDIAEKLGS